MRRGLFFGGFRLGWDFEGRFVGRFVMRVSLGVVGV